VGWWPGDTRYPHAAFFAYAFPATEGFEAATLSPPAAHWDTSLGEFILDWDDVCAAASPFADALAFRTPRPSSTGARCAAGTPRWRRASEEFRRR